VKVPGLRLVEVRDVIAAGRWGEVFSGVGGGFVGGV